MTERRLIPVKLDNYKPLREIVFESLREAIINGTLRPGERLMEVQLAEEMGVSRTPVREAIRKLELEGFVIMVARKGAYVAGISMKDVADVFEIRAALEGLAAYLAAERITDTEKEELERLLVRKAASVQANDLRSILERDFEFHELIYRASRNERLIQIINNLREQISRFRMVSLAFPGRGREALDEHKKIVEAIADRDSATAQTLAQEHIENAENALLEAMQRSGKDTNGE
ncbi:MAG: GntR family transcriptional regulator [Syntrophomonadaceae bacterium]|nr:GntR family transcriptional regulator [Syntrophomonadaceae bacterium]